MDTNFKENLSHDGNVMDIIIIGGGVSGCVCFKELSTADNTVYLFEARDRLGGRTCTEHVDIDGESYPVDCGGQWLSNQHTVMLEIVKEMELELQDQCFPSSSSSSSSLVEICCYKLKELDNESLKQVETFHLHMTSVYDAIKNNKEFDSTYYSNVSFYDEVCKYCTSISAQEEFLYFLQTVLAIDSKNCSFLFFVYYVFIFSGGVDQLGDGPDGNQALKVKGGTQQISNWLVKKGLKGNNRVLLKSPIKFIDYSKPDLIEVKTSESKSYFCKKLILALSPSLFSKKIVFNPPLEDERMKFYSTMVMGSVIKVIIVFEEAFWKSSTNTSSLRISEIGLVHNIFDTMVGSIYPGLVCLITGKYAIDYHEIKSLEQRKDLVLQQIKNLYSNYSEPIAYIEKDWIAEDYSGGCYAAVVGPGGLSKDYDWLRTPVDNRIFISCSESSENHYGYMEGAAQSARSVVKLVNEQVHDSNIS